MPTIEELIQRARALGETEKENKSKRLQVLATPSMFDALKGLAKEGDCSVNSIINDALVQYMKDKKVPVASDTNMLSVYLDEYQYSKLCSVAASLHKSPEEVANNVIIGYLAIVETAPEGDESKAGDE